MYCLTQKCHRFHKIIYIAAFPSLEEAIVQSCLLKRLLPTASFQLAVHSLISLLLAHQVVSVNGPSLSGKTSCLHAAAETLRLLGYSIYSHMISVGALAPNKLFGDSCDEKWVKKFSVLYMYSIVSSLTWKHFAVLHVHVHPCVYFTWQIYIVQCIYSANYELS